MGFSGGTRARETALVPAEGALGNAAWEVRWPWAAPTASAEGIPRRPGPEGEPPKNGRPEGPLPVTNSPPRRTGGGRPSRRYGSYLVDSASSHMLVLKIKPCMSKYKQLYSETANGSLNQLSFI